VEIRRSPSGVRDYRTLALIVHDGKVLDWFRAQNSAVLGSMRHREKSGSFWTMCAMPGRDGEVRCGHLHRGRRKDAATDKEALARKPAEVLTLEQIAQLLGHSSDNKVTKKCVH
jgi:hypothetical protein